MSIIYSPESRIFYVALLLMQQETQSKIKAGTINSLVFKSIEYTIPHQMR